MKKNVASQTIGAQMVSATDGSAFTGAVTAYVTGDGGTQALGGTASGVCTHEGNGFHSYVPTQAETNYDHIGFTFIGTGAIPSTLQVYPNFPQTVDNNVLAAGATGFAAIDTVVDAILVDTGTTIPATISTAQADLDTITGADGATLATTQGSVTWGPVTIAATGATPSIDLNGSGSGDGLVFSRSGAGDLFGTNWAAAVEAEVTDALNAYDAATGTELAATEAKIDIIDTNVDAILVDTNDLQTNQGAWATATGFATETKQDAQDAIITEARLAELDAANLPADIDNLNLGIIYGAAATGTLSTTQATSDLTGYADDQLIGRVIIWTSGACEGEGTDITDYASASGLLTFTALTTAPANTDTFKII